MKLRRSLATAVAMTALAVVALTGCDAGATTGASGALTIAKPDGAIPAESNNPWVGDSSAVKLGYYRMIYEPLAMVNPVGRNETTPWLASAVTWNADYTELTVVPRADVTWSDGTPFTADDIVYTFTLVKDTPALDTGDLRLTDIATIDGDVVMRFAESRFVAQDRVLGTPIVPKHVWEGVDDPTRTTNPDPVGTGPYTLTTFTTQSVELTARKDYWGGEPDVPTLFYVSYNDNTALTTALGNGDADWAQASIPNVQSAFIDKDPEHNVFWAAAGLADDVLVPNTTRAPFDDVAFRRAVDLVVDRARYTEVAREGVVPQLTSITGLPTPVGERYITPQLRGKTFEVDVDTAKQILRDAGYSWDASGALIDPRGQKVAFRLTSPQGWNDYVTGLTLIADQVRSTLGVDATVSTPDADTWMQNVASGDFDATLRWAGWGVTPYGLYSDTMDGRWLRKDPQTVSANVGRFQNDRATELLAAYAGASGDEEREAALADIQRLFVDEVPVMPVGTRPALAEYNTRQYVGWPSEDDPYATGDPQAVTAPQVIMKLRPAG